MNDIDTRDDLSFGTKLVESYLLSDVDDVYIADRSIVLNIGGSACYVDEAVATTLHPWQSTTIERTHIKRAERLLVIRLTSEDNLGSLMTSAWTLYADIDPGFPREVPLFISPQVSLEPVQLDLSTFGAQVAGVGLVKECVLKLNLWYCPSRTDCMIHTDHKFLEIHTQIHGIGHMQKFKEKSASSIYEDTIMMPGFTHSRFFEINSVDDLRYPWHQYFSDSDCIWMAVECHFDNLRVSG